SVIITLLALSLVLLPLGVGLPVLTATLALARALGSVDRRIANSLLNAKIAQPSPAVDSTPISVPEGASWWRRTAAMAGDASGWRHVAWLAAGPIPAAVGFTA